MLRILAGLGLAILLLGIALSLISFSTRPRKPSQRPHAGKPIDPELK